MDRRYALCARVCAVLLCCGAVAHAKPKPRDPPRAAGGRAVPAVALRSSESAGASEPVNPGDYLPPEPARRWYGWQLLLSDSVAFALTVGALGSGSGGVLMLGGADFAVGGPAIHAGHGHAGKVVASLALRVALPLLGAYAGVKTDTEDCEPQLFRGCHSHMKGLIVGALAGMVVAAAIDDGAIANEDVPNVPKKTARWNVSPAVITTPGRYGLALVGSF